MGKSPHGMQVVALRQRLYLATLVYQFSYKFLDIIKITTIEL